MNRESSGISYRIRKFITRYQLLSRWHIHNPLIIWTSTENVQINTSPHQQYYYILTRVLSNMLERILIPTDFSWYAQKTLFCAPEIPGVVEAVLLHVTEEIAEPAVYRTLTEVRDAQSTPAHALAYAGEILEKAGTSVTYEIVPPGDEGVHAAILASASRNKVDLILIGGKGRGFIKDVLLGSVSRRVLEEAKGHVLVTHFDETPGTKPRPPSSRTDRTVPLFSRILVPVDFSRPTVETIEFVNHLDGFDELILLHVITSVEDRKDLKKKLEHSMTALSALQRELDTGVERITPRIRFGDPGDEICTMAGEEDASIIIISRFGASDRSKDSRIGSVAVKVVKNASIPVLVR